MVCTTTSCTLNSIKEHHHFLARLRPVIPTLGRLRQEGIKFETSLGHIVRSCLKTKQKEGLEM
jgi:hypothetical protein